MMSQPEEHKAIEARIDDARMRFTVLEQETLRLKKERVAEEYAVQQLIRQRDELKSFMNVELAKEDGLERSVSNLQKDFDSLVEKIGAAQRELAATMAQNERERSEWSEKRKEMEEEHNASMVRNEASREREARSSELHSELLRKHEAYRNFGEMIK